MNITNIVVWAISIFGLGLDARVVIMQLRRNRNVEKASILVRK